VWEKVLKLLILKEQGAKTKMPPMDRRRNSHGTKPSTFLKIVKGKTGQIPIIRLIGSWERFIQSELTTQEPQHSVNVEEAVR
jgi:hypothetical protein